MKLAIATLLVGSAASSSIRAHSRVGKKLLSKARRLDGGDDMSWAADYSLQFQKCATTTDYYGGYFGGDGNNNNNDKNNYNGLYEQRLVHFSLCPTDSCGSDCTGGADYVVDMNEFAQAYTEYRMEAMEQECERVAENCDCENANDDEMCEMQCYKNEGIYDQCVEQDNQNNNGNNGNNGQQEEEFELEEVLECAKLDVDEDAVNYYNYQNGNYNGNNNNNQNNQEVEYFVGPYCSADGKSVLLGVFMDEVCSYAAPEGTYEKFNYGKAMPYSSESIITNECISCLRPDDDNNNNGNGNNYYYRNNNQDKEVLEFCEEIYEDAGKCETDLDAYGHYTNTMACDFIEGLQASGKTRIFSALAEASSNVTPKVLAGVFAVTTLAFGGVALHFHKKLQRQSVGLVHAEGTIA